MNLHGSITELQNRAIQLYLKLEQRFKENSMIRELWGTMAHDVSQQIISLKELPQSFWNQLQKDQKESLEALIKAVPIQTNEKAEDISLPACFELILGYEEPAILRVYVPIIRSLRKDLTAPALDFYIMVKAHLARIVRVIESFSGNPIAIRRSNMLLQGFEKEIQELPVERMPLRQKARTVHREVEKVEHSKKRKTRKLDHPLSKHTKIHHTRAKPLIKKVNIQRRRAHR